MKRIVVGISGATGAIYGIRLLEILRSLPEVEVHLVLSSAARRTIPLETDYTVESVEALATHTHRSADIAASISSGSFRSSGMVVAPCSMKTASGIAHCYSDNLLLRAADVTLKDRRPLLLLVRETPLHIGHLEVLLKIANMGGVIMPPLPAFYHRPATIADIVDQTVNRTLDLLGIELERDLFSRWNGDRNGAVSKTIAATTPFESTNQKGEANDDLARDHRECNATSSVSSRNDLGGPSRLVHAQR